jgi:hypothetical protein
MGHDSSDMMRGRGGGGDFVRIAGTTTEQSFVRIYSGTKRGVMRHTLARSISEEGTSLFVGLCLGMHHVLTSTVGAAPTNKPKCIAAYLVYFATSCTSQQGIHSSSSLSFLLGG